ncbi:methylated-DNA--[protein]-cysteine S-methyltransferase [Haploplasma modicum]|uniref:methylated-DNA--[protein]-cysteine S-methyltransferase n=1 Tax=Haploplasma modicum TaxID=2150 RepID=UPI00047A0389|nr:methylated-DNA--[protein]-cysteine S-methyltransferase [Haploplasma modicum]
MNKKYNYYYLDNLTIPLYVVIDDDKNIIYINTNLNDFKNDQLTEINDKYKHSIWLEFNNYFNNKSKKINLKIKFSGTKFEIDVWNKLLEIPYGINVSYSDIAKKMGNIKLSRAVGNAIGKNPILIIIPCHRVIKKDGSLGGFSSGINNKIILQNIEKNFN